MTGIGSQPGQADGCLCLVSSPPSSRPSRGMSPPTQISRHWVCLSTLSQHRSTCKQCFQSCVTPMFIMINYVNFMFLFMIRIYTHCLEMPKHKVQFQCIWARIMFLTCNKSNVFWCTTYMFTIWLRLANHWPDQMGRCNAAALWQGLMYL